MYFKEILKFSSKSCVIKDKIHNIKDKMAKLWEAMENNNKKTGNDKWVILWVGLIRNKEPVFG